MSLNLRNTQRALKQLDVGVIEVKKRGIEQVTAEQFGRLKLEGPNKATVILTRLGRTRVSIIAKRPDNDLQAPARQADRESDEIEESTSVDNIIADAPEGM